MHLNMFQDKKDFVDGVFTGDFACKIVQKRHRRVKLLLYSNQICYVSNINAIFESLRCSASETSFSDTSDLERHLVTRRERVKQEYAEKIYELRETLFEIIEALLIRFTVNC